MKIIPFFLKHYLEFGMKKFVFWVLAVFLTLFSVQSLACVGKTLVIGALDTPNDRLLAQMMAVIINERTGTTVNVEYFDDHGKLFAAVKEKHVNIFTENTGRALELINKKAEGNAEVDYLTVKQEFKSQFHLVLLLPFGKAESADNAFEDVPVIDDGVLVDYPALPRVLNKLKGIAGDKGYGKLLAAVESGDKPTQVARDFLKKKRFI